MKRSIQIRLHTSPWPCRGCGKDATLLIEIGQGTMAIPVDAFNLCPDCARATVDGINRIINQGPR